MNLCGRLLALIGLHSMASAAPAPAGAQPPFEYQVWAADHVVIADSTRAGDGIRYRLNKLLKGDAHKLQSRKDATLDVDDTIWRQLGKRPVTGKRVLLLLKGPRAVPPVHAALEWYVLDARQQFVHAPDDATVRKTLLLADLENLLRRPPFDLGRCGQVTQRSDFVLCSEVLHAGTRSEGRIGRLYRYGAEMTGERKGQIIDTESTGGGTWFIFLGNERPHLWSVSGWDVESNPR